MELQLMIKRWTYLFPSPFLSPYITEARVAAVSRWELNRGSWDTHSTGGIDARPLHGDGDTVEEDDDQHDVVKQLMGDDLIAQDPEPGK